MFRSTCAFVSLLFTATFAPASDSPPSAPIPTQVGAAKRVFISNMGGECQDFTSPGLFGTGQPLHHGRLSDAVPTAYETLYSALKTWGRFDIVLNPGDADLVFQIHLICPSIKEGHPVLELQILDPKTHIALWGFNEIADPAELQKNRDVNFERAMSRLEQNVKNLFGRADTASASSTK